MMLSCAMMENYVARNLCSLGYCLLIEIEDLILVKVAKFKHSDFIVLVQIDPSKV